MTYLSSKRWTRMEIDLSVDLLVPPFDPSAHLRRQLAERRPQDFRELRDARLDLGLVHDLGVRHAVLQLVAPALLRRRRQSVVDEGPAEVRTVLHLLHDDWADHRAGLGVLILDRRIAGVMEGPRPAVPVHSDVALAGLHKI